MKQIIFTGMVGIALIGSPVMILAQQTGQPSGTGTATQPTGDRSGGQQDTAPGDPMQPNGDRSAEQQDTIQQQGDQTTESSMPTGNTMTGDMTSSDPMSTGTIAGEQMTGTSTTTLGQAGNSAIRFVSSERVQAVPADTAPASGQLPICTAGQEDNCINRFEATGKGNRPLDRFPEDRSASPRR